MSYPLPTETPPPVPARPRPWLWIGAVALALVAGAGGTALALSDSEPSRAKRAAASAPTPAATPTEVAQAVATPTPVGYEPKPSDFKLTPKITDKECFGSAGCLVDFRVDVAYSGLPLGDGVTWLVVYEINGVEDAPQVGSLRLTGDEFTSEEESVDTKSTKSKITLKVTSVDKA